MASPVVKPNATKAWRNEKAHEIRAMFSAIAPTYDRLNHLLSFQIDRRWRKRTVRRAIAERGTESIRHLDICSGTGDLALDFARCIGNNGSVVATDFSHEMLIGAGHKTSKRSDSIVAPILIAEADALELPFTDDRFDLASNAFGLRNLVDKPAGIVEMARVVRPGGRLVILEFSMPNSGFLKPFYRFYLGRILPGMGNALSGSKAYSYLADTVEGFAMPDEICAWMRQANLDDVQVEALTGGIAYLYSGVVR